MDHVTLNKGLQMPIVGFGVFQIPDPKECERSVVDAIEAEHRLIDTAASYLNDEPVGRGLRASDVPREQLFITTKLSSFFSHRDPAMVKLIAERRLPI